jgi:hypothetical protein
MERQGGAWEISSAAGFPLLLPDVTCGFSMQALVRNMMLEDVGGIVYEKEEGGTAGEGGEVDCSAEREEGGCSEQRVENSRSVK